MPEPILTRALWFAGILGAVWLAFSVVNLVLGVSTETARSQAIVVIAIAWGLAAWRRGTKWSP